VDAAESTVLLAHAALPACRCPDPLDLRGRGKIRAAGAEAGPIVRRRDSRSAEYGHGPARRKLEARRAIARTARKLPRR